MAGGEAFDSSAGFKIGSRGAVKCPDASWVSAARIATLTAKQYAEFWPLSPDVAIGVRSWSDDVQETIAKIKLYVRNGSRYAAAIDPTTREVVELGVARDGLMLNFDAIIDA